MDVYLHIPEIIKILAKTTLKKLLRNIYIIPIFEIQYPKQFKHDSPTPFVLKYYTIFVLNLYIHPNRLLQSSQRIYHIEFNLHNGNYLP